MSQLARPAVAAAAVVWAALPWALSGWLSLSIPIFIALHALVAVGLTVLTGHAGQVSMGQAAFYGLGAYVSGILTVRAGVDPWVAMLAAVAAAVATAYAIGLPILQLRGHYLALATLGLNIIFEVLFRQLAITGGANGLPGIPALSLFGLPLAGDLPFYYLTSVVLGLAVWMSANLLRSRVGRALAAIRCSEALAESLGIDPGAYKSQIFVFSAALAALAGSLYGYYLRFISPSAFTFSFSIELLVMVVLGGVGSVTGAVTGAALVTLIREALRSIMPRLMGLASAEYEIVVFGVLLAAVAVFMPEGVWPRLARRRAPGGPRPGAARQTGVADGHVRGPWRPVGAPAPHRDGLDGGGGQEPVLVIERLSHNFGGLSALSGVSLAVHPGEVYAVIGPNGAGKTTLFNLIGGLLRPRRGRIEWRAAGERSRAVISGRRACAIASLGIARTFQTPRLVPEASALENVQMGLHRLLRCGFLACLLRFNRAEERDAREEALRLLELVGIGAWAAVEAGALPFGGQRLVELARALAMRPRLLMLDEPASGLSEEERRHLARLLRSLGISVLIVEHDVRLVSELADRVLVLNYGCPVAEGTPEQVRRNPRVQAAYLGSEVTEGGAASSN